jgi:hypothetical protein
MVNLTSAHAYFAPGASILNDTPVERALRVRFRRLPVRAEAARADAERELGRLR